MIETPSLKFSEVTFSNEIEAASRMLNGPASFAVREAASWMTDEECGSKAG